MLAAMFSTLGAMADVLSPETQNQWKQVTTNTDAQLRGLSVVNSQVAWASGVKGTVLKTIDGKHWQNVSISSTIPAASELDFRDIQGFSATTAIAMSAGPGKASTVYKTSDGGTTWKLLMVNSEATGFWDAMDFWDEKNGVIFGDPVNGQFQILITQDGGETWQPAANKNKQLTALANEGAFAASGTCVVVKGKQDIWFVTGGAEVSRVFHSSDRGETWTNSVTEIPAAAAPKGLFSAAFFDLENGFVVGGDYSKPALATVSASLTKDAGKTWQTVSVLPQGFLSVVTTVPKHNQLLIAGGLTGIGFSTDGGLHWKATSSTPINTVAFADAIHGWAVGPKGLIMQYVGIDLLMKE